MTKQPDQLSSQNPIITPIFMSLVRALGENRILIVLTISYIIVAKIISRMYEPQYNLPSLNNLLQALMIVIPMFLVSMIIWRFAYMFSQVRPQKPVKWLAKDLLNILIRDKDRIFGGAIAILSVILMTDTFTFLKEAIPVINPFAWDTTFTRLDQFLHGGVDPYKLLTPIFANPPMTMLADTFYSLWFSLVYFFAFIAAMDRENPLRRNRFLFAFFLCWIIGGSLLATIFSSVGPVYYQVFGYGDHFKPLLNILYEINQIQPIPALKLQAAMLEGYNNGSDLTGISAMPSMHLVMAWLMVFQAFRYSKLLGWAMIGFALMIQLASVYLAWHYAVDGYAGFVVALICWKLAMPLARLQVRFDTAQ